MDCMREDRCKNIVPGEERKQRPRRTAAVQDAVKYSYGAERPCKNMKNFTIGIRQSRRSQCCKGNAARTKRSVRKTDGRSGIEEERRAAKRWQNKNHRAEDERQQRRDRGRTPRPKSAKKTTSWNKGVRKSTIGQASKMSLSYGTFVRR